MKKKNKIKKKFVSAFYLFTIFILGGFFIFLSLFVYFAKDLPRPERYTDQPIIEPTKIYDRTGENILYTIYGEEKREITSLNNVPQHLIDALLTSEDKNFYEHIGIDFRGIIRSAILNFRAGEIVGGGSTISQQFVRSALLTPEKKVMRKIREIVLTLELERRYSKDEILEFYLNQIPFGSNAYGVESAAQTYFNKTVKELTLAESATLISLLPSPSYFSPFGDNLEELIKRKNNLLERMYAVKLIDKENLEKAKKEDVKFHRSKSYLRAPHFVMHVKSILENKYGEGFLEEEGLSVYTTIDFEMQKKAEEIIKNRMTYNDTQHNAYNSAMVVINPKTGEVISMVGSADYFKDSYPPGCQPGVSCKFDPYTNVALRERQPGSAFKPIVYATALENGYSSETVVVDEKTNFGTVSNPYIPQNYDGLFRGEVTLKEALAQSLNVPSIKVLRDLAGLQKSIENAKKLGVNLSHSADFYGLPLVLGGGDVKLLEMVSAYGVFASEGYKAPTQFILKIVDKNGNIIEETKNNPRKVLNSSIAREITDILSDNKARAPVFGYNSPLYVPYKKVSVKTGSTQNYRDAWCIGYTSDIVVGVWVGNNDNTSMRNAPGVVVAAPIWRNFIDYALQNITF